MNAKHGLTSTIRGEGGSAYLAVLLVLLILTIMALSLATITNLEMEIGTAERAITRTFYASNSGLQAALARVMTKREYEGQTMELFSGTQTAGGPVGPMSRGFRIAVSPMVPIGKGPCNLCPRNLNEKQYYWVNHAVTSTASELTWGGDDTEVQADAQTQAQKTLSVMFQVQPWEKPDSQSIDLTSDEVEQVKF